MDNGIDWARVPAPDRAALTDPVRLDQAANCLAWALSRGYDAAPELADAVVDQGVRLRLLNWPTPALQPLEIVVVS